MKNSIVMSEIKASLDITYDIQTLTEQFINYGYEVSEHSKYTMRTRATHLRQFATFCSMVDINNIRKINISIINAYFTHYNKTHSKSTTNTGKRILRVFVAWLIEYKEIPLMIRPIAIKTVKIVDKAPKAIDLEVVEKVIKHSNEQDSLIIATMFEAGLRISELVNIRMEDMNVADIRVMGKGSIERVVHITYELATELLLFADRNNRLSGDFLFQKHEKYGGGRLSSGTARVRIQNCFNRIAGIHMYPHQLRHTFAVNLLMQGCNIVTIQRLLGHQDVTTTMVYLRVSDSHVRSEYQNHIGKSFIMHKPIDKLQYI